ncbi:META domain-containing protein [Yeosuana sp. MJ-SS3]|uniref:META domain-containing protein n=1 Tax=Gilvirhabdus luticola TaxID=3079858 RepID=A0ABU3U440_9FLAO|nr:META domain-containing protein [Yeosuana sp. MJ-SS3]MDU8884865.1 META domain-containing protein [Yeosuana sp. MJ-SS3]
MKFSLLLCILFSLKSCGNTSAITSMQENTMQQLSGNYSVTKLINNDTLMITPDINFDASDNRVSGFSGCNRFNGSYTIDGNNITFGPLASTKMMCREEANTIEHNMFDTLSQVNSFSLQNNILTLFKDKDVLLTAKQDNSYIIEYTAVSRGVYQQVIVKDSIVSFQKNRTSKPISKTCNENEWNKITANIETIQLSSISKLEAPSKAHQYDGAALANLKITYQGKDYQTQTFDHGNPPNEIAPLVKEILSIAQNIE